MRRHTFENVVMSGAACPNDLKEINVIHAHILLLHTLNQINIFHNHVIQNLENMHT